MADKKENTSKVLTIDSKYRKILIAAKRSKQIQKGARPRLHEDLAGAVRPVPVGRRTQHAA